MRRWLRFAFGMGVSVLFLVIVLRGIDWLALKTNLLAVGGWIWFGAATSGVTNHILRAMRWGPMLAPIKPVPLRSRVAAVMIGNFANNVLPLRLGEVARSYVLAKNDGISLSAAMVSVVLERLLDILSVVFILAVVAVISDGESWVHKALWSALLVSGLGLATLGLAYRYRNRIDHVRRWAERRDHALLRSALVRLCGMAEAGVLGASSLATISSFVPISLLTVGIILAGYASHLIPLLPFSSHATFLTEAWVAFGFVTVALAIPSAPANIGSVQYACWLALRPYGFTKEESLAYSFVYQGSQFVPLTLLGMIFAFFWSVRFRDIAKAGGEEGKDKAQ